MIKRLSTTPFSLISPDWFSLRLGVIRFFKTSQLYRDNNNNKIPLWFPNSFHILSVYTIYISAHLDGSCHFFFIIFSIVTIDSTSPVPALVNISLTNPVGSIHHPSFNSDMASQTSLKEKRKIDQC